MKLKLLIPSVPYIVNCDTGIYTHFQVTEQVFCFVIIVLECKGQ